MTNRFHLLITTLLLSLTAAVAPVRAQTVDGVAAVVNDEVITTYDVLQRVRLILTSSGVQATPELIQRVQAQALRGLIDERIQLQEAAEYEIQVTPEEVAQALERLARQNNMTADVIARDLAQVGVSVETLEDQLRAEIAWQALMSGLYGSRVRVSDDQISQALERIATNAEKNRYLISEILIEPQLTAGGDQTRQVIQFVYEQLQQTQGQGFPQLARQFSAAASAVNGGDVGWVRSGELRHSEIERELGRMRPGAISPPIETRDGYFIILLRDAQRGSELERVHLRQVLLPAGPSGGDEAAMEEKLQSALRRVRDCDDMERVTRQLPEAIVSDLGMVKPSDLAANVRDAVAAMEPGETTEPMVMRAGAVALTLCERQSMAAEALPSRAEIENQLRDQQLSLLSRRYLRNLLETATIETRLR